MDYRILQQGDIKDKYLFEKSLGQGVVSEVKRAKLKSTGVHYAIKIITKLDLSSEELASIHNEIDILFQIDHPNIVKLYEVWEDSNYIYMVLELLTGGELFDRIVDKDHYSEKEAVEIIKPIADAIRYCHAMGITHRDLKAENLLFAHAEPTAELKIADFGLAKVNENRLMKTQLGFPIFVAPEILTGEGYDQNVDYWSLGIILYLLLSGYPPFYDEDNDTLLDKIQYDPVEFPDQPWKDISNEAKDLILKLLEKDPNKRIKSEGLFRHPWITGMAPETDLSYLTDKIRKFYVSKRFQKMSNFVIASNKWSRSK